ncbi:phosphatidylinositol-3-phosphatase SAC1 [Sugiyamaella lignohabitans]|uniref:Phosphatidylinositol-3-phosphatase SAC1 n=1 Tax=Sugiyamaella lignohabitans TaxID=796027 RepID=A0A170QZR3_9ASCO|nr:phosphatidylinositol-3-phosphatase SAC1 [Sugiyamaella lignohabitans]ANB16022.1 phosphatidylinositol-3-phosphatase SAC1 [Sugiyamaella lignohabitans]
MAAPLYYSQTDREYQFVQDGGDGLTLSIGRPDGEIRLGRNEKTSFANAGDSQRIGGILGIIRLRLTKYIVVIKEWAEIGQILGHPIYRALKYDFLPLREWRVKDDSEKQYLSLLRDHLDNASLFFSYGFDLTNSFQRKDDKALPINSVSLQSLDDRFFWNKYLSEDLLDEAKSNNQVSQFIQPVIYGVISIHDTSIVGQAATFGVISRRSRFRAGTRYFRRGIDDEGNVANYNETEQILIIKDRLYSFVQTRGSVPAYWAEINNVQYKPQLRIGGIAVNSAKRHFDEQIALYGPNYLVNLVNQKGYEKPVKDVYENVVRNLNDEKNVKYVYFDFHHECSKMRWYRVNLLIEQLETLGLDSQKWFSAKLGGGSQTVIDRQTSVVRTNCMDCLDRTNVVQSQLAKWILQRQLQDAGILEPGVSWETDKAFLFVFRNTWADNADGVSCAYSGTGALKTDFTRLGRRTKRGALSDLRNSLVRYYKNNFTDGPRQDGFDLFLGNHLPHETLVPPFFDSRPLSIQAVPYTILGSFILLVASVLFPKEDSSVYVNRALLLVWLSIFLYSLRVFIKQGMQFVNWPKLCGLTFVSKEEVVKKGISSGWRVVIRDVPNARGLEEGKFE